MVKNSKEDILYSKVRRHMKYVCGSLERDREELFKVKKDCFTTLKGQNITKEIIMSVEEAEQKIWEAMVAVGNILGNPNYLGYEDIEEEEEN